MQVTHSLLHPMDGVGSIEVYAPQYDLAVLVYPVRINDVLCAFTCKDAAWECNGIAVVTEEVKAFIITLIKNGRT